MEPGEPNSGIQTETLCSEDKLDKNWQKLIITHITEKAHLGVLTGSPITDIKITLVNGRAHQKHTESGDFRQATYRAIRNGLMQAESVLLEPWYSFEITVPTELSGRVMTDITKMGGEFCVACYRRRKRSNIGQGTCQRDEFVQLSAYGFQQRQRQNISAF